MVFPLTEVRRWTTFRDLVGALFYLFFYQTLLHSSLKGAVGLLRPNYHFVHQPVLSRYDLADMAEDRLAYRT